MQVGEPSFWSGAKLGSWAVPCVSPSRFSGIKWTLLVVRALMFKGKRYYAEFLASREGIATGILADRLKTLESGALIVNEADRNYGIKRRYGLTEKGGLDLRRC